MIGLDLHFVINNEENFISGIPTFEENVIYISLMVLPFIFLLSLCFVIKFMGKKRGILLLNNFKITNNIKKIKGINILLFIIIGVIFIAVLFIFIIQNKLLYYPSYDSLAYINLTSKKSDMLEEISISTDKELYHGWGYKNSPDYPTVIYFGGNAQSSENFFFNMEEKNGWDNFKKCNVIMIDYPGYGLSEGKTEYKNILHMADATYQYVKESEFYGNKEIIVMGFSLGTGVATYIAASYDTDGLILVAPYNNAKELYNNVCNIFHGPLEMLIRNPFPSDEFAHDVTTSVLIIASEDDEVIPFKLSKSLKDTFKNNEFVKMNGLYHNELLDDERVLNKIKQYLSNY